ncbi:hypothetical protein KAJ27_13060, partial [bacterium]|nr:hypothetical protein [bacterium]
MWKNIFYCCILSLFLLIQSGCLLESEKGLVPSSKTGWISGRVIQNGITIIGSQKTGFTNPVVYVLSSVDDRFQLNSDLPHVEVDSDGQFKIYGIPVGTVHLLVDLNNDGFVDERVFDIVVTEKQGNSVGEIRINSLGQDESWYRMDLSGNTFSVGDTVSINLTGKNTLDQAVKVGIQINYVNGNITQEK